uniref:transposase n=3 Tax=Candidatus Enterovibrio escicola TaxID=1927127 RepID=UPI001237AE4D|nr:transposase [Candidatus Enterovibrio escacola]
MKPKVMKLWNRLMLRKRFIIETVFDLLKNISQIKHLRHRSYVNLLSGLIAYSFQLKKPSIKMTKFDKQALMQILG